MGTEVSGFSATLREQRTRGSERAICRRVLSRKNAAPDSHIVKHMYALRVLTGTHVLHCRVREEVREEEGEEEEESEGGNKEEGIGDTGETERGREVTKVNRVLLFYSILFCPVLSCPVLFYSTLLYSILTVQDS